MYSLNKFQLTKLLPAILAILLLAALTSCGGDEPVPEYRADLTARELAEGAGAVLADAKYMADYDDESIGNYFGGTDFYDAAVYFHVNDKPDEYGIFRIGNPGAAYGNGTDQNNTDKSSPGKNTAAAEEFLRGYLKQKYDSYIPECMPAGEYQKLENSEVRTFGTYAVFAIMSAEDMSAFFNKLEEMLLVE